MTTDDRDTRLQQLLRGRDPLAGFDDLPEKEAAELYRQIHGCSEIQARFVIALERGTLPTREIDKDGNEIMIVY